MNSIPHYWASMLRTIYYLEDPRERAQALLNLKRPPVHDARYLQLVYSVERNAGHSGAVLARRAVKNLQLRDRSGWHPSRRYHVGLRHKDGKCLTCGKEGHFAKNCPDKPKPKPRAKAGAKAKAAKPAAAANVVIVSDDDGIPYANEIVDVDSSESESN